ncbi:hypothetical protein VTP01DRAFT_10929 [Rhizomucor pusillus]|uniref:uncharacterized protein n=1 Tax=Rhizomucor pusillus TaxID=4840 RepID=UPI003743162E
MWRENSYRGTSRAESDSPLSQPRETAIVVFGSGMFGKDVPLKGQQSGVVGILWKELKKREANGEVVVATIDEYLTSQICHTCLSRILENVVTDDGVKHHRIQVCKSCRTL